MVFMQDNAPCHKSKTRTAFFDELQLEKLPWPPQSLDLNPIENIWHIVKTEEIFNAQIGPRTDQPGFRDMAGY